MKILFVFSGNTSGTSRKTGQGIAILKNPRHQGDTLIEMGYYVDFYQITGKGFWGYIKNIPKIRRAIKKGEYDIIHAHYSYSAIAASLAGTHRMVVSLMGSDTFSSPLMLMIIRLFCLFRWKRVIVKTDAMAARIRSRKVTVLPNGVNTELFRPIDKSEASDKNLLWGELNIRKRGMVRQERSSSRYRQVPVGEPVEGRSMALVVCKATWWHLAEAEATPGDYG